MALKVVYVLTTLSLATNDEEEMLDDIHNRQKWDMDDKICRGHILNKMRNELFDVYHSVTITKKLWDKLETRYMREDATSKKFLVCSFFNYKMIDKRHVMNQFAELEKMFNHLSQHNMLMDETIVVSFIIHKLASAWNDFKRDLKHKKEETTIESFGNIFFLCWGRV